MTQPLPPNGWDLDHIKQIVIQNDLERGRIEYKAEIGTNGNTTVEAIAALANTFGGVVLVGIDERQPPGPGRIVGVEAGQRDRLSRMCWDRLVPPFSPDIVPIKLDQGDNYVLAVIVDPAYARRPVMVSQGNKIPVRIEGHNVPADWHRLRDLFAEQPGALNVDGLTARSIVSDPPPQSEYENHPPIDFGVRGQLWLSSPRGGSYHITEAGRQAALDVLNDNSAPITGPNSAIVNLVSQWLNAPWTRWNKALWQLHGRNSTSCVRARWWAFTDRGRRVAETLLTVDLKAFSTGGASLTVQLDTLIASPEPGPDGIPVLDLGMLGRIILDTTATLWGPLGETLSSAILGQHLGPPAELAISLGCLNAPQGQPRKTIDEIINFGKARLIFDSTPGIGQEFESITPDQDFLDPAQQETTVRQWLIELGINQGYENVEQEVALHTLR